MNCIFIKVIYIELKNINYHRSTFLLHFDISELLLLPWI